MGLGSWRVLPQRAAAACTAAWLGVALLAAAAVGLGVLRGAYAAKSTFHWQTRLKVPSPSMPAPQGGEEGAQVSRSTATKGMCRRLAASHRHSASTESPHKLLPQQQGSQQATLPVTV